jgi:ABC-2 type transport system ATP-binding protein
VELKIERLSKTYPNGVHALRDVSLTIAPGMFGLLGPNGAGKSTLMRILATLQEADAGRVRLGEIDVLRDKEAVRRTLGYLPQEFGLYPRATAEEMLDHFAVLKGVTDGRERHDTVQSLLQQTNLWEARHRRLGTFSGGMRQRFGIAVALIGNPRLIIVDEPTAGLDPAERARFLNLLSELGENAVVILSTHIVEDVSDLCQRMAIIHRGQILLEAEPQAAVRAVRGRVWRREVPREELKAFETAHPVISTTLVGGRTVVHVHGDAPPDDSFHAVEPDLKDVYFTVMRGIGIDRPGPQPELIGDDPASSDNSAPLTYDFHRRADRPAPAADSPPPDDRAPAPADSVPPPVDPVRSAGESAAPADETVTPAATDDPWARFRRPGSSA